MVRRPRLLDLFCGAGGAAVGYHQAGFDVTGIDIADQPHYPYGFTQWDALEVLKQERWIGAFDAIHASPPCQAFTHMSNRRYGKGDRPDQPDHLTPTLERLRQLSVPWVVENVVGSVPPLRPTIMLHGGMFGLGVHRPRLFESNILILAPKSARTKDPLGVYGKGPDGRQVWTRSVYRKQNGNLLLRAPRSLAEAQEAMGMDWGDWHGVKEAIPPAYTQWIGEQLIAHLEAAA